MLLAFGLGAAVTATNAARMLLQVAAVGMTMGRASASLDSISNTLHEGDSDQRLEVLAQLKESLSSFANVDPHLAEWIAPAIEKCRTDPNPRVVDLANEIGIIITAKSPTGTL